MFKDAAEAEQAERDQDADCARIDAAIRSGEQEIAALEGQQLDPDEMLKEWSAIRDRTIVIIRDARHNVLNRAKEAKATERWMTEKLMQESKDKVLCEFSVMLKEVPTKDIVDYLRYLILIGDRARIQSVSEVFAARKDRQSYDVTFSKMLAQFALAECGELGGRLSRICHSADKVDARVADLFCAIGHRSHAPTPRQST
jgi:hypothetical protein